ncbi:hypothetical protein Pth03_23570 [Planotetraspora thailandica]|uniref:DUF2567 domain-containing protein n=1 Tax=Planotetraspora thailandica TaxID=487172 RepID=A0A8J3UY14_9ACTN|nr:hypothetical protein [Planotetraspora thailandica]GII53968.1 hypothetical protein Pth03_23570 [Planotetraspora thailandica]
MRHLRGNLTTLVTTVLALALLGVAAGFVWSALAPVSQYVITDTGPELVDLETQTLIQADGWFAVVGLVCGLLSGVAAYLLARRRPVAALLGLAGGGLLAGYIALLVGSSAKGTIHASGPGGVATTASLGLTAHGVMFAWPVAATGIFWVVEFVVTYRLRGQA